MEQLEARIEQALQPFRREYELLQTIPGVKEMTAASILAEIGADMSQFRSAKSLTNRAGICPGNNRSAGKSKRGRIQRAGSFLIPALVQAGWAAARKQGSLFQRRFQRWMRRLGERKANIAIARSLIETIYVMLRDGVPYREPEPGYIHQTERAKLVRHHARRLRQPGADENPIEQLVDQMNEQRDQSSGCSPNEQPDTAPATIIRRTCPAKLCRGALGFRARQTRKQEYSVMKDPSTGTPRRRRSVNKNKASTDNPNPD